MKVGEKMTAMELDTILNSWPEGTPGNEIDRRVIDILNKLGAAVGYGMLRDMANWMFYIQCGGLPRKAAAFKRERFKAAGWKLPDDFEQVAAK